MSENAKGGIQTMLTRPNLQPEEASITSRLEEVLGGKSSDDDENDEVSEDASRRKPITDNSQDDQDQDASDSNDEDKGQDKSDEGDKGESSDPETVAEYLGLSANQVIENEDGTISIATNVNGAIQNLPLSEVIKGYQIDAFNSQKGMKLGEERVAFEKERTEAMNTINTNIEASMIVLNQMEQDLIRRYDSENWDILKAKPEEFNMKRAEYSDQARNLDKMKSSAMSSAKKLMEDNAKVASDQQLKDASKQRTLLLESMPELADTAVYETTMTSAKDFMLKTYGVTEKEANQITDSRLIRLIFDAQKFHSGKKQLAKKEGGKKLPKFMKTGSRRSSGAAATKDANKKRATLRKTGSTRDAANLLIDRM